MNRKQKQVLGRFGGFALLAALALFINNNKLQNEDISTSRTLPTDVIEVHFIDVGQGDAILIETGSNSMLIDAGENNKGTDVIDYLHQHSITELDYVIGTHPHSDHIGGLDTILENFEVHKVIMPEVSHITDTFEDVLDVLEEKDLHITRPVVGDDYELGSANFTIIAPSSSEYDDMNDYSVGIKLTYGNNSFLLAGDASTISEEEMLDNGLDMSADVLKLSHHGSKTSSSEEFLEVVDPDYAMICVGNDNEYNHPSVTVLQAISNRRIKLYRTDKQGTVVFTSDGENISVNTNNYNITNDDLKTD